MALTFKKRPKQPGTKAPTKIQPFRATRGPKFVFFVGDEGAVLVYIKGNVVQSRQFVHDATALNLGELRPTIETDPQAPIYLVVDSMDQQFVQQTLPPVSSLSVGKLIKRRLERDFGVNDIKGAISLGREATGRKDWNYLMIALEKTQQLTAWLDFIEEFPNRFRGIRLVSVEAEILIKSLERAMGVPKEGTGAKWKFFVSHNKVGGFRQVILRNGRIIFTRLAQPIGDSSMEMVAGSIEQEMLSTIEYMRRLSFNPQDGLDIYILASSGIKDVIDRNKFAGSTLHVLTPFEVSEYLNIEGATQPSDQFGDVILAAVIGCTRKAILTLSTPQSRKIDAYSQLMDYQRVVGVLAAFGLIGYAISNGYDIYNLQQYTEELTHKKAAFQQDLNALQSDIAKTNLDVEKANDLIQLYQQMVGESLNPSAFMEKIQQVVTSPMKIKIIDWQIADSKAEGPKGPVLTAVGKDAAPKDTVNKMVATLTLEFPPAANNPKVFAALSQKTLADFKKTFPAPYEVAFGAIPEKFLNQQKVEIDFGEDAQAKAKTDNAAGPEVQLIIKGEPVVSPAAAASTLILTP